MPNQFTIALERADNPSEKQPVRIVTYTCPSKHAHELMVLTPRTHVTLATDLRLALSPLEARLAMMDEVCCCMPQHTRHVELYVALDPNKTALSVHEDEWELVHTVVTSNHTGEV